MPKIPNSESPMIEETHLLVAREASDEDLRKWKEISGSFRNNKVTTPKDSQKPAVIHLLDKIADQQERKKPVKKSKTAVQKVTKVVKTALKPIKKIMKKKP